MYAHDCTHAYTHEANTHIDSNLGRVENKSAIYWLRVSSIGALPLSLQVDFHCVSFDGLHMKMNTVKVWLVALVHVNELFLTAQHLP